MNNFKEKYSEYTEYFNNQLNKYLQTLKLPNNLLDAIKYSLFAGGKRIRPVLTLAFNDILGGDKQDVIEFAIAIEMIHTYSLIHDDLPSMDNDDYRRGKLSSHKMFGEAMAILAGDTLLNLAFETVFKSNLKPDVVVSVGKILSNCSGGEGMIAGQVYDLFTSDNFDSNTVELIIENKTSKLLTAPLLIASTVNNNAFFGELNALGKSIGRLFQIKDDIFDYEGDFKVIGKTTGKDVNKNTYINLIGIDKTKSILNEEYYNCKNILNKITQDKFINDLIDYIYNREN
jgi:geranylgeranyl diphosphate synthase type II